MTTVTSRAIPFDSITPYSTKGVVITIGAGERVSVTFNFGGTDIEMANAGMTPSVLIHWLDGGVDKIGFNGTLATGNPVEVKHPDTYITQFVLLPMYVSGTTEENGRQEVEIFLYEIYG